LAAFKAPYKSRWCYGWAKRSKAAWFSNRSVRMKLVLYRLVLPWPRLGSV